MSLKEDDFIIVEDFVMDDELDIGDFEMDVIKELPLLEDLEITPSGEEQNFKSENYYGFDNVKVKAVEMEEIEIVPSKDIQIKEGAFNKVTVQGDDNLVAENIAKGKSIFGVEGTLEIEKDEEDGNAKVDSKFTKLTFPATVTLPSALGEEEMYQLEFVAEGTVKNMNTFDCFMFEINSRINNKDIFVSYMSEDGINYTNIDGEMTIDFGVEVGFNPDTWHDYMSYFMQLEGNKTETVSNEWQKYIMGVYEMFYSSTIVEGASIDTSNVTEFERMYYNCRKLTSIPLYDMGKACSISSMFTACAELVDVGGFKDLGKGYPSKIKSTNNSNGHMYLSHSTKLTHESLMNIINNLYDLNVAYDVANGGTLYRQQLTLGTTNLAKLTADEIAIATNKGWNVV